MLHWCFGELEKEKTEKWAEGGSKKRVSCEYISAKASANFRLFLRFFVLIFRGKKCTGAKIYVFFASLGGRRSWTSSCEEKEVEKCKLETTFSIPFVALGHNLHFFGLLCKHIEQLFRRNLFFLSHASSCQLSMEILIFSPFSLWPQKGHHQSLNRHKV